MFKKYYVELGPLYDEMPTEYESGLTLKQALLMAEQFKFHRDIKWIKDPRGGRSWCDKNMHHFIHVCEMIEADYEN